MILCINSSKSILEVILESPDSRILQQSIIFGAEFATGGSWNVSWNFCCPTARRPVGELTCHYIRCAVINEAWTFATTTSTIS